jgi:hypothetical protein
MLQSRVGVVGAARTTHSLLFFSTNTSKNKSFVKPPSSSQSWKDAQVALLMQRKRDKKAAARGANTTMSPAALAQAAGRPSMLVNERLYSVGITTPADGRAYLAETHVAFEYNNAWRCRAFTAVLATQGGMWATLAQMFATDGLDDLATVAGLTPTFTMSAMTLSIGLVASIVRMHNTRMLTRLELLPGGT